MRHSIIAASIFAVFVVSGLLLTRRVGLFGLSSRQATNLFLVYVLGITCSMGIRRGFYFPFQGWQLYSLTGPSSFTSPRFVAVDASGTEHDIDHRAWQPINLWELRWWFTSGSYLRLDSAEQVHVGEFLVRHVEAARVRARAGESIGSFNRVFGPLAVPLFNVYRKTWTKSADVPAMPFVALRWYEDRWNIEERARNPEAVSRTLVREYRVRP